MITSPDSQVTDAVIRASLIKCLGEEIGGKCKIIKLDISGSKTVYCSFGLVIILPDFL